MPQSFKTYVIAFGVILGSLPIDANAWSALGHQTSAAIADSYLSSNSRGKVQSILNGESMEKASTWADAIKDSTDWKHTKYYHYKNIPLGETYLDDLQTLTESKRERGDIIRALLRAEDIIVDKKTSPSDRKNALRFYIHLLGDLHQPLHAGFVHDSGGNSVSVTWYGYKTNLHSLWDRSLLLTYGKIHFPTANLYSPQDLAASFSPVSTSTLKKWSKGSYEDWLNEAIVYRDEAYKNLKATNDAYYAAHAKTLEMQLHKAGYRMALLLEELLAKVPSLTDSNMSLRSNILSIIGSQNSNFDTVLELHAFVGFRFYEAADDDPHDDCHD